MSLVLCLSHKWEPGFICLKPFSLAHKHKHKHKKNKHVRSSMLMRLCLCLCASENSIRQISGFVLLMFLLMLTLMSRVFSLVMLMLCLCPSEDQPLCLIASYNEGKLLQFSNFHRFAAIAACNPPDIKCINAFREKAKFYCGRNTEN